MKSLSSNLFTGSLIVFITLASRRDWRDTASLLRVMDSKRLNYASAEGGEGYLFHIGCSAIIDLNILYRCSECAPRHLLIKAQQQLLQSLSSLHSIPC